MLTILNRTPLTATPLEEEPSPLQPVKVLAKTPIATTKPTVAGVSVVKRTPLAAPAPAVAASPEPQTKGYEAPQALPGYVGDPKLYIKPDTREWEIFSELSSRRHSGFRQVAHHKAKALGGKPIDHYPPAEDMKREYDRDRVEAIQLAQAEREHASRAKKQESLAMRSEIAGRPDLDPATRAAITSGPQALAEQQTRQQYGPAPGGTTREKVAMGALDTDLSGVSPATAGEAVKGAARSARAMPVQAIEFGKGYLSTGIRKLFGEGELSERLRAEQELAGQRGEDILAGKSVPVLSRMEPAANADDKAWYAPSKDAKRPWTIDWWASQIGEQAPVMASMFAGGGAGTVTGKLAGLGKRGQAVMSRVGALGTIGAQEGANSYHDIYTSLVAKGLDPATAQDRAAYGAAVVGTTNALLETIPYEVLFLRRPDLAGKLVGAVGAAVAEGATEGLQELRSILSEVQAGTGQKWDQSATDRVLQSIAVGGVVGGATHGIGSAVESAAKAMRPAEPPAAPDFAGMTDEQVAAQAKSAGIDDATLLKGRAAVVEQLKKESDHGKDIETDGEPPRATGQGTEGPLRVRRSTPIQAGAQPGPRPEGLLSQAMREHEAPATSDAAAQVKSAIARVAEVHKAESPDELTLKLAEKGFTPEQIRAMGPEEVEAAIAEATPQTPPTILSLSANEKPSGVSPAQPVPPTVPSSEGGRREPVEHAAASDPSPTIVPDENTQRSYLEDRGKLDLAAIRAMPLDELKEHATNIGAVAEGPKLAIARSVIHRQTELLPEPLTPVKKPVEVGTVADVEKRLDEFADTRRMSPLQTAKDRMESGQGETLYGGRGDTFALHPDDLDGLTPLQKEHVKQRVTVGEDQAVASREILGNKLYEAAKAEALNLGRGKKEQRQEAAELILSEPDRHDPKDVASARAYLERIGVEAPKSRKTKEEPAPFDDEGTIEPVAEPIGAGRSDQPPQPPERPIAELQHHDESPATVRVYHGTRAAFEKFATKDPAMFADDEGRFFFVAKADEARQYAEQPLSERLTGKKPEGTPRVIEAMVSFKKPYVETLGMGDDVVRYYDEQSWTMPKPGDADGYDGIIIRNDAGDALAVAFDPAQINITQPDFGRNPQEPQEPQRPGGDRAVIQSLIDKYESAPDGNRRGEKDDYYVQWRKALADQIASHPAPPGWSDPNIDRDTWSTYIEWTKEYVDQDGDEQTATVKVRLSDHNEGKGAYLGRADLESQLGRRDGKSFDPLGDEIFAQLPGVFAAKESELSGQQKAPVNPPTPTGEAGASLRKAEGSVTDRPEATSQQDVTTASPLRQAFDKYDDTGEYQVSDLADAVEALVVEGKAPAHLQDAIDEYRADAEEDSREFAGRGDADAYESKLVQAVENELGKEPKSFNPPAPAQTGGAAPVPFADSKPGDLVGSDSAGYHRILARRVTTKREAAIQAKRGGGSIALDAQVGGKQTWAVWKREGQPDPRGRNRTERDYGTPDAPNVRTLSDHFAQQFEHGNSFLTIVDARKEAELLIGGAAPREQMKKIDEAVEVGVVRNAQRIARSNWSPAEKFDAMVKLLGQQPNLSTRTSTSVSQQAYSTPAPLAFLASQLAGINADTTVYEPTAGNGMLLVGADPKNVVANELNPDRAASLKSLGYFTTTHDATDAVPSRKFKAVIANPPFGRVRDAAGTAKVWHTGQYRTPEIDHAIAFKALSAMDGNGRAVLILGSKGKETDANRAEAYRSGKNNDFYHFLYNNYNVTDHFTVSGDLYKKQGAGFPVDVIVIEGRGKSGKTVPMVEAPRLYSTWEELKGRLNELAAQQPAPDLLPAGRGVSKPADRGGRAVAQEPEQAAVPRPADVAGRVDAGERGEGQRREGRAPAGEPNAGRAEQPGTGKTFERSGNDAGGRAGTSPGRAGGAERLPGGPAAEPAGSQPRRVDPEHRPSSVDRPASAPRSDVGETEFQVAYSPGASSIKSVGTLVPRNMRDSIAEALRDIAAQSGSSIEEYVADELGYNQEELGRYFSAEQVDATAMAIANIKAGAGFIIGDQTGVGKGRFVAAMLRYAQRQGLIPVFITEKPNLYADIIRDISDIGMNTPAARYNILTTNDLRGADRIELPDGRMLESPADVRGTFRQALDSFRTGKGLTATIGKGNKAQRVTYNAIATNYSQMQSVQGKESWRQTLLRDLSGSAMLIFDESHNAGGTEARKAADAPQGRAELAREMVGNARAVIYSSATYAKRPSVMDLYAATDMKLAVDNIEALGEAIKRGGIPMQQAVANMLAQAKQYIRRERSFQGVEFKAVTVKADHGFADRMSEIFRSIDGFDKAKEASIDTIVERLAAEGKKRGLDTSTGKGGVHSTNFTSLMHNVVDQMLLATKVESAVADIKAALDAGQKPVVALSNTMESLLDRVMHEAGAKPGDSSDASFRDVMERYLERSREIIIKPPGAEKGESYRHRLTDAELGPVALRAFQDAAALIERAPLDSVPASPIDYLIAKLEKLEYTHPDGSKRKVRVGEITGRHVRLDYSKGQPTYDVRAEADIKPAGRVKTIKAFQNGDMDIVILNQAGSTGISLHADKARARDQRRRHMFILQADKNIDTFMQMLGRVHRTGQVVEPTYSLVLTDLPTELRPASVLTKKLASLNANVTADSQSAVGFDVPDVMNVVGDAVALEALEGDPELQAILGLEPEDFEAPSPENAGAVAAKITGRVALLPLADQEAFWQHLGSAFDARLNELRAMGENPLRAENLDLDAKTVSTTEIRAAKSGEKVSPFTEAATLELVDAKSAVKPYTSDEVRGQIADSLKLPPATPMHEMDRHGQERARAMVGEIRRELDAYIQSKNVSPDTAQRMRDDFRDLGAMIGHYFPVGKPVMVAREEDGANLTGVVTKLERRGTTKNPAAPSGWHVTVALPTAEAGRELRLPLSAFMGKNPRMTVNQWTSRDAITEFDRGQAETRERRYVATGNLLAASEQLHGGGQVVHYTTSEGQTRTGILLPKKFKIEDFASSRPIYMSTAANVMKLLEAGHVAITSDQNLQAHIDHRTGHVQFTTPKARARGGIYYLHKPALDAAGAEYVSAGNSMTMRVPKGRAASVINAYMGTEFKFVPHGGDKAREVGALIEGVKTADDLRDEMRGGGDRAEVQYEREEPTEGQPDSRASVQREGDRGLPQEGPRLGGLRRGQGPGGLTREQAQAVATTQRITDYFVAQGADAHRTESGLWKVKYPGGVSVTVRYAEPGEFAFDPLNTNHIASLVQHYGGTPVTDTLAIPPSVEAFQALPDADKWLIALGASVKGTYSQSKKLIVLATETNMGSLDEEVFHAVMAQTLTAHEYSEAISAFRQPGAAPVEAEERLYQFIQSRSPMPSNIKEVAQRILAAIRSGDVFDVPVKNQVGAHQRFMTAYHGSPHTFDKFSTEKIGTGEGVQAFGHGLYFAGNKEVAEYYRRRLSEEHEADVYVDGKPYRDAELSSEERDAVSLLRFDKTLDESIKNLHDQGDMAWRGADARRLWHRRADIVASMRDRIELRPPPRRGRIYQVELTPKEDEYLLWDSIVQSKKVNNALKAAGIAPGNLSGQQAYHELARRPGTLTTPPTLAADKEASALLHSLGVRGIKYLDGSSRSPWSDILYQLGDVVNDKVMANLSESGSVDDASNEDVASAIRSFAEFDATELDMSEEEIGDLYAAAEKIEKLPGASFNYVIFSDEDVTITEVASVGFDARRVEQALADGKMDNAAAARWLVSQGRSVATPGGALSRLTSRFGRGIRRFFRAIFKAFKSLLAEAHNHGAVGDIGVLREERRKTVNALAELVMLKAATPQGDTPKRVDGKAFDAALDAALTEHNINRDDITTHIPAVKVRVAQLMAHARKAGGVEALAAKQAQQAVKPTPPRTIRQAMEEAWAEPTVTEPQALKATMKAQARAARGADMSARKEERAKARDRAAVRRAAFQVAKDKLKATIAAIRDKAQREKTTAKALREELAKVVTDQLPKSVRGEFIRSVAIADTFKKLLVGVNRVHRRLERYEKRQAVNRLARAAKRINVKHLRPEYQGPVRAILDAIDLKKMTDATRARLQSLAGYMLRKPDVELPASVAASILRLSKRSVADMTTEEINDSADAILELSRLNSLKNKLIAHRRNANLKAVTQSVATEVSRGKPLAERLTKMARIRRALGRPPRASDKAVQSRPVLKRFLGEFSSRFAQMLDEVSPTMKELVYDTFGSEARNEQLRFEQDGFDALEAAIKPHGLTLQTNRYRLFNKFEAWRDTPVEIETQSGPMELSNGELAELRAHAIAPANRQEILAHGLTRKYNMRTVHITADQLDAATDKLDPIGVSLSDAIHRLYNGRYKDAINRVWVKVKGHEKATVPEYHPRPRDIEKQPTGGDPDSLLPDFGDISLEGWGALKERTGGASPVMLFDALDAFAYHTHGVARTVAYLAPYRDVAMVLGQPAVKQALRSRYGQEMVRYIAKRVNQQAMGFGGQAPIAKRIMGLYAKGVLSFRLPTVLIQPSGMAVSAAHYDSPADMAAGLKDATVAAWNRVNDVARRFSPQWRDRYENFYYHSTSGVVGQRRTRWGAAPLSEAGMEPLLLMDKAMGAARWSAAEHEVARTHPGLTKGSDAYHTQVARVWERVINASENTSAPIEMSGAQAYGAEHPWFGPFVMFGSAPTKLYTTMRLGALQVSRGQYANGVTALSMVALSSIMAAAVRETWRGLKDSDDEENKPPVAGRVSLGAVREVVGSVPIVGDTLAAVIRNVTEDKQYAVSRDTPFEQAFEAFGKLATNGASSIETAITGELDKDGRPVSTAKFIKAADALGQLSVMLGIPYATLKDYAKIGNNLLSGPEEPDVRLAAQKIAKVPREAQEQETQARRMLWAAVNDGDAEAFAKAVEDAKAADPTFSARQALDVVTGRFSGLTKYQSESELKKLPAEDRRTIEEAMAQRKKLVEAALKLWKKTQSAKPLASR